MLRFLYYTALILGLFFLFKYFVRLLLMLFVNKTGKRIFNEGLSEKNNQSEDTVVYKQKSKQSDSDIIEFEEE